jgi:tetratricopeptide (TPR) repeat protein
MARTFFGLGKYKDSERIFNELLDKDPYSTRYWNALASAQFMNEDFSGAIVSSEYAIAIDPHNPEGLLSKANGLYQLGNYEEAVLYYNRYIDVAQPDELVPQIYQELALCHSSLHHLDQALAYIDKSQELESNPVDMLVMKGHIYLENDNIPMAEKMFKDAITRSHNAPIILLRIIVSLYDNRYVKACYEMFKKFFSMVVDDNFRQGYSYMALCCWDLGYTEEFLKYLHIAIKRNPTETRIVLRHLFPENMAAKDYYDYMYQKLKK